MTEKRFLIFDLLHNSQGHNMGNSPKSVSKLKTIWNNYVNMESLRLCPVVKNEFRVNRALASLSFEVCVVEGMALHITSDQPSHLITTSLTNSVHAEEVLLTSGMQRGLFTFLSPKTIWVDMQCTYTVLKVRSLPADTFAEHGFLGTPQNTNSSRCTKYGFDLIEAKIPVRVH